MHSGTALLAAYYGEKVNSGALSAAEAAVR
jgi:hypothetical protein